MDRIIMLLDYLDIDINLVNQMKSTKDKVDYLYSLYQNKVFYDTTVNFLNKVLYYEVEEAIENILEGCGCSCQELHFVFKDILKYFSIPSKIIHSDIYDYKTGFIKKMYGTSIIVQDNLRVIHIDILKDNFLYFEVNNPHTCVNNYDIEVEPIWSNGYSIREKNDENITITKYKYYLNISETYRIDRLIKNYSGFDISPFGVISPFYSENKPERKIFYQPFKDVIRIYKGQNFIDFDLLDWFFEEESSWLNKKQKERIKQCVSSISLHIELYMQISIIENNFELISKNGEI